MDITPYVDRLREQLLATAAGSSPEVVAAAERMTIALDPAVRLTMMEALAEASAEITRELPAGSVDVRLSGRSLDFIVELPPTAPGAPTRPTPPTPPAPPTPDDLDDGDVVRITLRLPENLKNRAEEQATKAGQSLNTWLVNAVRDAVAGGGGAVRVDIDLSSLPFGSRGSRRMSGWA